MERIVFLERNTIQAEFRRPSFDHEWIEYGETFSAQVVERLRGATIAISNKLPLRSAELSQLPSLKLIAIAATGSDNIDLDYCRRHGIAVSNTRGYAVNSVPEHVLMMMLALRRNLLAYREDVRQGNVKRQADEDEQHRMREFHLQVYCSAKSRKRDQVNKAMIALKDGKASRIPNCHCRMW